MAEFNPKVAAAAREESPKGRRLEELEKRVEELTERFRQRSTTPPSACEFEKELKKVLDAAGRQILEEEFNRREADDKHQLPPKVRYRGETYRINKKTKADIATSFGTIALRSFLYLCEEPGEPGLHPLHVELGVVAGSATAVLAERVGRWAVDYSQREVRQWLWAEHGLRWSNDRLRRVLREFRDPERGWRP